MSNFSKFLKNNSANILALTVSVLTLFIYVRQTNILAEQTRASLWPYVSINHITSNEGTIHPIISSFNITVKNSGTGPAIVERVVVKINSIEVEFWGDLYNKVSPPFDFGCTNETLFGKVIMPGETIKFIDFSNNFELMNYLYSEHFDNLEIAICYKSVYDEYWTVSVKGFGWKQHIIERQKSNKCTLNATTYFVQ